MQRAREPEKKTHLHGTRATSRARRGRHQELHGRGLAVGTRKRAAGQYTHVDKRGADNGDRDIDETHAQGHRVEYLDEGPISRFRDLRGGREVDGGCGQDGCDAQACSGVTSDTVRARQLV